MPYTPKSFVPIGQSSPAPSAAGNTQAPNDVTQTSPQQGGMGGIMNNPWIKKLAQGVSAAAPVVGQLGGELLGTGVAGAAELAGAPETAGLDLVTAPAALYAGKTAGGAAGSALGQGLSEIINKYALGQDVSAGQAAKDIGSSAVQGGAYSALPDGGVLTRGLTGAAAGLVSKGAENLAKGRDLIEGMGPSAAISGGVNAVLPGISEALSGGLLNKALGQGGEQLSELSSEVGKNITGSGPALRDSINTLTAPVREHATQLLDSSGKTLKTSQFMDFIDKAVANTGDLAKKALGQGHFESLQSSIEDQIATEVIHNPQFDGNPIQKAMVNHLNNLESIGSDLADAKSAVESAAAKGKKIAEAHLKDVVDSLSNEQQALHDTLGKVQLPLSFWDKQLSLLGDKAFSGEPGADVLKSAYNPIRDAIGEASGNPAEYFRLKGLKGAAKNISDNLNTLYPKIGKAMTGKASIPLGGVRGGRSALMLPIRLAARSGMNALANPAVATRVAPALESPATQDALVRFVQGLFPGGAKGSDVPSSNAVDAGEWQKQFQ